MQYQIDKKVAYNAFLTFVAENQILCTKWRTITLRQVSPLVTPKQGLKQQQRTPRLSISDPFQGFEYDPTNIPTDEKLVTERAFCVGGKRGCAPNPQSTNQKAKNCSISVVFDYYLNFVHIKCTGEQGANFQNLGDWQMKYI